MLEKYFRTIEIFDKKFLIYFLEVSPMDLLRQDLQCENV